MNRFLSISLIFFGTYWLFHTILTQTTTDTASMSDAMQLESDLYKWMEEKRKEGKLEKEDVFELFPEGYSLALGGEDQNRNFREMVREISTKNLLPSWPGLIAVIIGVSGLISTFRKS